VGELYIGGEGVARGYLNGEELTRERFIANPFSEVEGSRLYRTGDLVRWLPGGELMFVGRRDDQVKIRGFRIELGEIEQQLALLEGVNTAVVMAREEASGEKRLVAYVVPNEYEAGLEAHPEITRGMISDYREQLASRLPDYMVPSAFVLLEQLPLTANGKVDRKALPAAAGPDIQTTVYVAPRNSIEQALCDVWQAVLKRDQIGVQDNFFSLGGDSILSIRVVSMLKTRGIVLGINDIFQYQTIEDLAIEAGKHVHWMTSKMSNDAAEQKERMFTEGKTIEEGVFL
jgi:aryl carrier-like protein